MRIVAALSGNALLQRGKPSEDEIRGAHHHGRTGPGTAGGRERARGHARQRTAGRHAGPGERPSPGPTRQLAASHGWQIRPDGSGFRRVVPSSEPAELLDLPVTRILVAAWVMVVCCGGRGVPVVREGGSVRAPRRSRQGPGRVAAGPRPACGRAAATHRRGRGPGLLRHRDAPADPAGTASAAGPASGSASTSSPGAISAARCAAADSARPRFLRITCSGCRAAATP